MIELSVVIPAYNEAKRLPATLKSLLAYFNHHVGLNYEIIVIDDGSSDGTSGNLPTDQLTNLKTIILDKNHGKGYAVKQGMAAAKGRYILMMDADGSIPIVELDKLWPYRDQYDLVIGSRFLASSRFGTQKISRVIVSKIGNILFRFLFNINVHDTQCGFKLFQAHEAKKIFDQITINRFGFDMEVLVLAKQFGCKTKEIAIDWHDSPRSSVRAVRSSWQTLKEVVTLWQRSKRRIAQ